MEIEFDDEDLDRLETEPKFTAGFEQPIVRSFRKVMQFLRSAEDERDIYAMRGLQFKKLKGKRDHERSIRLNQQWRLILEIKEGNPKNILRIMKIEDYH